MKQIAALTFLQTAKENKLHTACTSLMIFIYRAPSERAAPFVYKGVLQETHKFQLLFDAYASTQPVLNAENINKIGGIAPLPSTTMNAENVNKVCGIALFSSSNIRDEIESWGKFRDAKCLPRQQDIPAK
jgi:hypothetical protein